MTLRALLGRRRVPLVAAAALAALLGLTGGCGSGSPARSGEADGALVYATSCASCHGADLRGTDKGPSHLSIVYEPNHHRDDAFRSAIANGAPRHHWNFGDMEPVEGLSDIEVEAVIGFIRAEQQRLGFEQ